MNLKKLRMSVHFQARMAERNINLDHVKQAINNPDSKKDTLDSKIKVTKKVEGKTIEVIYCTEKFRDKHDEYILITAYYK